jgi:aminoglycoside/choline kinase family phosphotransferase
MTITASGNSDPTIHPDPSIRLILRILRDRSRPVDRVEPMAGDVSRRRYLRLHLVAGGTAILAVYPEDMREACSRSLFSGRLLHEHGVRVATVLESDCQGNREVDEEGRPPAGWTLLEDLGQQTLYDRAERPWAELEPYFREAVDLLPRIASLPPAIVSSLNPSLDRVLLFRELEQTRELFFVARELDPGESVWNRLESLCERLGAEKRVPCHRDFGARNLIPLASDAPSRSGSEEEGAAEGIAVVDHQDLRLGPRYYDLASLLNDSLFPTTEGEERLLVRAGVRAPEDRERYHRAAAQRTLKAIGSYAAFAERGDERHMPLVGPTLERALDHLRRVPEAAEVVPALRESLERWRGSFR